MAESSSQTSPPQSASDGPLPPPPASGETLTRSIMFNLVIPVLLLLGAAAVVLMLGTVEPEERPPDDMTRAGRLRALPPVRVERLRTLESTGEQLQLEVDGSVVPYREARVAAEVAGRVVFKADECEAGSYVKKDQLLMRIDPTDYELEVQRLTRVQEQEYQALGEVDQEMTNAKRSIGLATQDVALQQKEVDRQKALPAGFASRGEIDQANRALLAATQQLVNVENQLDLFRKRRFRLETSERLAATLLKVADVNLKRTEIRAPIEGVIVNEDADLNTFVARGNTLVTIEDTSKVEVATNLRMDQLYWVLDQNGETTDQSSRGYDLPETPAIIEYELAGRAGVFYRWQGRLLRYDGIGVDPVTRTVPVRVVVDNPTEYIDQNGQTKPGGTTALVRGMFVRVKLLIQPKTRLVVIPARALQPGNRVLQFVPDESVLNLITRQASNRDDTAVELDSRATAEQASDGSFNPNRWEPGRVFLRRSVNPVDSLALDGADSAVRKGSGSEFDGANRMWVCEVHDTSLSGGSYVVVSPWGSVDDAALPVRADRTGLVDDQQATDTDANQSTTATELGNAEDA